MATQAELESEIAKLRAAKEDVGGNWFGGLLIICAVLFIPIVFIAFMALQSNIDARDHELSGNIQNRKGYFKTYAAISYVAFFTIIVTLWLANYNYYPLHLLLADKINHNNEFSILNLLFYSQWIACIPAILFGGVYAFGTHKILNVFSPRHFFRCWLIIVVPCLLSMYFFGKSPLVINKILFIISGVSLIYTYYKMITTKVSTVVQAQQNNTATPHSGYIAPTNITYPVDVLPYDSFKIEFGYATGIFAERGHVAPMKRGEKVMLTGDDPYKGILIVGPSGSGKTTGTMHPILLQGAQQDAGMLIFDMKNDFEDSVHYFLGPKFLKTPPEIITVGIGHRPLDLLAGLKPDTAVGFLRAIFGNVGKDPVWVNNACIMASGALGVLEQIPGEYSLAGLYRYVFDKKARAKYDKAADEIVKTKSLYAQQVYKTHREVYRLHFEELAPVTRTGVESQLASILQPFQHPKLVRAFSVNGTLSQNVEDKPVQMQQLLDGAKLLIKMPRAEFKNASQFVYHWIKLLFQNTMENRSSHPEWNQDRPVMFICDEYQKIIDAGDANFLDTSRSTKTVYVVSTQMVASFYEAVRNDKATEVILGNLRQQIFFPTDDKNTLRYYKEFFGEVQKSEIQRSASTSTSQSYEKGFMGMREVPKDVSTNNNSESISMRHWKDWVYDEQLNSSIGKERCVARLNIDRNYRADVFVINNPNGIYFLPRDYQLPYEVLSRGEKSAWDKALSLMKDEWDAYNIERNALNDKNSAWKDNHAAWIKEGSECKWVFGQPPRIKTARFKQWHATGVELNNQQSSNNALHQSLNEQCASLWKKFNKIRNELYVAEFKEHLFDDESGENTSITEEPISLAEGTLEQTVNNNMLLFGGIDSFDSNSNEGIEQVISNIELSAESYERDRKQYVSDVDTWNNDLSVWEETGKKSNWSMSTPIDNKSYSAWSIKGNELIDRRELLENRKSILNMHFRDVENQLATARAEYL